MEFEERVQQLVEEHLKSRPDLFLIDMKISPDSNIVITIDGDQSLSLQDCLDLSRAVESQLDREAHDFSLQVTSSGLSEPLKLVRQYKKNIGRPLDLLLQNDKKVEGKLTHVNETEITLEQQFRRPKKVGKGKEDVTEEIKIPFAEIKKAMLVLKF